MGNQSSQMNGDSDSAAKNRQLAWRKIDEGKKFRPRDGHCACACRGKVFIFGGVVQAAGDGEHRESNQLLVFDPETEKFEEVVCSGSVPRPRSAATLAAVGSKIYLFGGLSNSVGWLNDMYAFDTETSSWTQPMMSGAPPSPRDKLASAVIGESIYYFGGFGPKTTNGVAGDDSDDDDDSEDDDEINAVRSQQRAAQFGWFDDLFVYNTATSSWSHPMHMNSGGPTARAAHTMCSVGTNLVIFGGRDAESRTDDLYVYETVSRKWVAGPVVDRQLAPRSFHAACSDGSHVVVVGGRGVDDQHFADCHVFDIESKTWSRPAVSGDAPSARGAHILVGVNNSAVLFGGSSDFNRNFGHCTRYYNDIYVLK